MTYLLFFLCRLYLKKNICICLLFGETSLICNKWKFNMKSEIEIMKSQGPHGVRSRLLPVLKRDISFKSVFGCPLQKKWGILVTVGKWKSSTILQQNFLETAARERAGKKDQQLSQHPAMPLDVVSVHTLKNDLLRPHKTVVQALEISNNGVALQSPFQLGLYGLGRYPWSTDSKWLPRSTVWITLFSDTPIIHGPANLEHEQAGPVSSSSVESGTRTSDVARACWALQWGFVLRSVFCFVLFLNLGVDT